MRLPRYSRLDALSVARRLIETMRAADLRLEYLCERTGLGPRQMYRLLAPGGMRGLIADLERRHWLDMQEHALGMMQALSLAPRHQRELPILRHITRGHHHEAAAHLAICAMEGCAERREWERLVILMLEDALGLSRLDAATLAGALIGAVVGRARVAGPGETAITLELRLIQTFRSLGLAE